MNALVFDLGTTNLKAAVFDPSLRRLALARRATPLRPRANHRSELDPAELIATLRGLCAELRNQTPEAWQDVTRISFATQANSFLLLDQHCRPITPIIAWNDSRARGWRELPAQLTAIHPPEASAETGIPALNEQYLPAKLLWLRHHEPGVWSSIAQICLLSDFVCHWLTGRFMTEASVAGLSGLLDIHRVRWRASALAAMGVSPAWLPEPVRGGVGIAPLSAAVASELGLGPSCAVIAGCLDQYAGAIGAGGTAVGRVTETTGTVLATVTCADRFDPSLAARGIVQGPEPVAGRYFRMCFGEVSGAVLEAYRRSLPDAPTLDALDREAEQLDPGDDRARLDVAHWLAHREVRFTGVAQPTCGQAVQAIRRAVAEALRQQVQRIAPDATAIHAAGGAARSGGWLALKSRIVGIPVLPAGDEPTIRGAAMIAFGAPALQG